MCKHVIKFEDLLDHQVFAFANRSFFFTNACHCHDFKFAYGHVIWVMSHKNLRDDFYDPNNRAKNKAHEQQRPNRQ